MSMLTEGKCWFEWHHGERHCIDCGCLWEHRKLCEPRKGSPGDFSWSE